MGFEFLVRIRRTSLMAAVIGALFTATYASYPAAIGFAAGAAWSLANLRLIEQIVTGLTGPTRSPIRAMLAILANVGLLAVGGVLLAKLPPMALAAGFTLPFVVILLKAVSLALLGSRVWAAITRSPWRAMALVGVLAVAAWFTVVPLTRAQSGDGHARVAAAGTVAGSAAAQGGHAAAGDELEEEGPSLEFDNLVTILAKANRGNALGHFLHQFEAVIFSVVVALLLCLVVWVATRDNRLVPGPFRNAVEILFEPVYDNIVDLLGPKYGPRYVPFLGSLFIYILAMNLFGIVPLMKSPTSSLNVTFALALTVFVYVQYIAITELGFLGWLHHLAGSPQSLIEWLLVPLAFPIHVLGEVAKPVSLSARLFGNIFGEDMLLAGFATLGISLMAVLHLSGLPFGLPLHFVFLFLALLSSIVQALVFALLSTVYILLMLPHEHEHEHEHGAGPVLAKEAHHPAH